MTPTERAKRSDALYYETVSVNRRVLCDMIANREADLEDAKAESEHMRLKALAVAGELQEENERLKADNAKLRESVKRLMTQRDERLARAEAENAKLRELVRHMHTCMEHYEMDGTISCDRCPLDNCVGNCDYEQRMRELGVEVDDGTE